MHAPDFYLTQWQDNANGSVHCYGLVDRKHFAPQAPKNIGIERYFYDKDGHR